MKSFLVGFISLGLVAFYCFAVTGVDSYNYLASKGYSITDFTSDILDNDVTLSEEFLKFHNNNKTNSIFNYFHKFIDWGQSFNSYSINKTIDAVEQTIDNIGNWFINLFRWFGDRL